MSASNPLPSASPAGGEARPYEPSMEEILASIRRIIADDQSLPTRSGSGESPRHEPSPMLAPAEKPEASVHVLRTEADRADRVGALMPDGEMQDGEPDVGAVEPRGSAIETAPIETPVPPEAIAPPGAGEALGGTIAAPQYPSPSPSPPSSTPIPAEPSSSSETARAEPARAPADEPAGASDAVPPRAGPKDRPRSSDGDDYFDPPPEYDRPGRDAVPPLFSAATNTSVGSAFAMLAATRLADNSDELLGLAREMIRPLLKSWLDDNLPTMVERMVREEIERVARGGH